MCYQRTQKRKPDTSLGICSRLLLPRNSYKAQLFGTPGPSLPFQTNNGGILPCFAQNFIPLLIVPTDYISVRRGECQGLSEERLLERKYESDKMPTPGDTRGALACQLQRVTGVRPGGVPLEEDSHQEWRKRGHRGPVGRQSATATFTMACHHCPHSALSPACPASLRLPTLQALTSFRYSSLGTSDRNQLDTLRWPHGHPHLLNRHHQ